MYDKPLDNINKTKKNLNPIKKQHNSIQKKSENPEQKETFNKNLPKWKVSSTFRFMLFAYLIRLDVKREKIELMLSNTDMEIHVV